MDHQKLTDLLHLLPTLNRPIEHITIDFFFDLLVTEERWNSVWLVDRFSKLVKLISIKKKMSVERLICQYMIYIYCNYELPAFIVSDQDPWFDADLEGTLEYCRNHSTYGSSATSPDRQSVRAHNPDY
jgi:hypothetical protein